MILLARNPRIPVANHIYNQVAAILDSPSDFCSKMFPHGGVVVGVPTQNASPLERGEEYERTYVTLSIEWRVCIEHTLRASFAFDGSRFPLWRSFVDCSRTQSPAALRLLSTMVWFLYPPSVHRQFLICSIVCSNLTLAMDGLSAPISVLDTDLYKVRVGVM
jgi:hypothetical protein